MILRFPQLPVAVNVVRTKRRKSIAIQIKPQGVVRLLVPRSLNKADIQDIINQRLTWINNKLKLQATIPPAKKYINGEVFSFLGRDYKLVLFPVANADKQRVCIEQDYLQVFFYHNQPARSFTPASSDLFARELFTDALPSSAKLIRGLLEQWFRQQATGYLQDLTQRYSALLGVYPLSVTIKSYKARWGSCSVAGDICYNWRIIIAPLRVVEYLVVHELCHILEHNHSACFWQHVANALPDFKQQREWLRVYGAHLFV